MKSQNKPSLAWKQSDYLSNKEELPESLINDDLHTEGELMTREEISEWTRDCLRTMVAVRDRDEKCYNKITRDYLEDVDYLAKLGKITPEESDTLKDLERLQNEI